MRPSVDLRTTAIPLSIPLSAAIILGLILRVWAAEFGLPYFTHPDEHYLQTAIAMLSRFDFNPHYFHNPPLLTYIHASLVILHYFIYKSFGLIPPGRTFLELYSLNPYALLLTARLLSALFGIFTCIIVYVIGKRMFNSSVGVVGCILLCFSFLHIRDSHYAVNDIPAVFFMTLAFYHAVNVYENGKSRDYILAAITTGLAIAMKYNVGLVLVPLICSHVLSNTHNHSKLNRHMAFALISCAVTFLICCPWVLFDYKNFWRFYNPDQVFRPTLVRCLLRKLIYSISQDCLVGFWFHSPIFLPNRSCFITSDKGYQG